jgi:cytochrome c peroxidase
LRNTPTLLNVAMQPAFFADDRALSLENQVGVVLASPAEMASHADTAAARVAASASYRRDFATAMPDRKDSAITGLNVRQALASYLRTLNALDSRFDRAVRGDTLAMTDAERRGLTVFLGRAKCGTCHFMPLFSGLTPPFYRTSEAEIIGVPATSSLDRAKLDPDIGRANVEDNPLNRFAFKVTSLRNVALTAPYMHNGVFDSLEQVIDFYDRGGGVGIGLTLPYQSLPTTPLKLTLTEKRDLVAFLGALTDSLPGTRRPTSVRPAAALR